LSNKQNKEALKAEIELMEKEIVYFKGRKRLRAKQRCFRLLKSCGKNCGLDETVYIDRI
jgi:hypothetical protein